MSRHKDFPFIFCNKCKMLIIAVFKRFFVTIGKSENIVRAIETIFIGTTTELNKLHAMECKHDEAFSNYFASETVIRNSSLLVHQLFVDYWKFR